MRNYLFAIMLENEIFTISCTTKIWFRRICIFWFHLQQHNTDLPRLLNDPQDIITCCFSTTIMLWLHHLTLDAPWNNKENIKAVNHLIHSKSFLKLLTHFLLEVKFLLLLLLTIISFIWYEVWITFLKIVRNNSKLESIFPKNA